MKKPPSAIDNAKFTKLDLARTLGELAKLGLIQPFRDTGLTRYRLTARVLKPRGAHPRNGTPRF